MITNIERSLRNILLCRINKIFRISKICMKNLNEYGKSLVPHCTYSYNKIYSTYNRMYDS